MTTYNVNSWSDLSEMRDDLSGDYVLQVDLDSSSTGYTGIGDSWEDYYPGTGGAKSGNDFSGSFDGGGHVISDLVVNGSSVSYFCGFIGFFSGTFVKNIIFKDVDITSQSQVGIVGSHRGTGDITGVGVVGGSITALESRVGIVGWQQDYSGDLNNCYNDGCAITASGFTGEAGGIIGQARTACNNCWSSGVVTADAYEGGLIGWDYNSLGLGVDSFWDTTVSGNATSDGGTGKTTSAMKDIDTYTDTATTGLTTVWDLVAKNDYVDEKWFINDSVDYPRLGFEWVATGSISKVKVSGTIIEGIIKYKTGGVITTPLQKVMVDGSLIVT